MYMFQIWLLFGLTILGAAPRGLPNVKERDYLGPQGNSRVLKEEQSSGKQNCTDCDIKEGHSEAVEKNFGAGDKLSNKNGDLNDVNPGFSKPQEEKKTKPGPRKRKGRHRKRGQKSKDKSLISSSKDKNSSETYQKEETRKLAVNIQHNIQRLGEISAEIKKLTGGSYDDNLKLHGEDKVNRDSGESGREKVDISLGNKPVSEHRKKQTKVVDKNIKNNVEDSIAKSTAGKVNKLKKGKIDGPKDALTVTHEENEKKKADMRIPSDVTDTRLIPADTDEKKPDHIVLGKVDDRWSRPGLDQVPDAARLERRLHPTIDAPIRDIMSSLGNILHSIQGSVYRAEYDYQYVFNSTRWTLMVGVRDKLQKLVNQNDQVYDIVLQAALLTKEIYLRAHERRHYGSLLAPSAVTSKDPVISTLYLRPLHQKAIQEIEKARHLKKFIATTIRQRGDLNMEFMKTQRKVEETVPSRTLYDLSRRAKQAMSILESAHAQRDMQDEVNLFGHMHRNTFLSMELARNFTTVGWEELMYAKRKSMESKHLAGDIMKAYHERVPGMSARMPFDHVRMILWTKVDIATLHADDLFKSAATIHVQLEPLIGKAKVVLQNYDRDPLSQRIKRVADEIRSDLKALRRVMDTIIVSLKAEHLLIKRCETVEGSGGFYDDDEDMTPVIDCDEYVTLEIGSGTDEEGSGELDGVLVDIDKSTLSNTSALEIKGDTNQGPVDIDITDMTNMSKSIVDGAGDIIDIDEDLDGRIVLPTEDIDIKIDEESEKSSTVSTTKNAIVIPGDSDDEDIIKEALRTQTTATDEPTTAKQTTDKQATTKPTTAKPTTVKQATTKPTTAKPTTVKQANTKPTTAKPTTVKQATTKPTTAKPTTVKQAATKPTTAKPTTVTQATTEATTANPTTVKPADGTTPDTEETEEDGDFGIANWFGWGLDEPVRDVIAETEGLDVSTLSFNELLRSKLSNYAITSKDIYGNTTVRKEKAEELSLTWRKVRDRFERFENRTLQARAFTSQWEMEHAAFKVVHNRVQTVLEDVTLKTEVVQSQSAKAVEKAELKLKKKKEQYKTRSEQASQAADPELVREARESVAKFQSDVSKIVQLTRLAPAPCKLAEAYQSRIKANISELRQKIEQAKLIASSLQIAVELDGSSHLRVPVKQNELKPSPLTTRLDMVVKVTDSDGVVIGVETNKTGSFVLTMKDGTPKVITFDDDKYEIDDLSTNINLEEDTWYRFVLERIAQTFNLTVYDVNTKDVVSKSSVMFDDDDVKPDQSPPIAVYVGGLSDEYSDYGSWSGCIGTVMLDGQSLSLLRKDFNGKLPGTCTSDSEIYHQKSGLVLDGSGFAHYDLHPILRTQRSIHSVGVKFRPASEGLLLSMSNRKLRMFARAVLEQDGLVVQVKMPRGRVMSAKTDIPTHGADHSLQIHLKGRPRVSLDGTNLNLKPVTDRLGVEDDVNEGLYVGAAPAHNRSLIGCIHSITVNKNSLLLSAASELQGGFFGTCMQSSCVKFSETSSSISKKSVTDAKSLHIAFTYGSMGPVVQYIKKDKKFDVTVTVDDAMIEMFESVSDTTDKIPLDGYSKGDLVVVTLEDIDKKVWVKSGDSSVSVKYEEGGGWLFGGGDSDSDDSAATYTISVGASTESEDQFKGQVEEVVIKERPMDLSTHSEKSSLGFCKSDSQTVSHWIRKEEDQEKFSC